MSSQQNDEDKEYIEMMAKYEPDPCSPARERVFARLEAGTFTGLLGRRHGRRRDDVE